MTNHEGLQSIIDSLRSGEFGPSDSRQSSLASTMGNRCGFSGLSSENQRKIWETDLRTYEFLAAERHRLSVECRESWTNPTRLRDKLFTVATAVSQDTDIDQADVLTNLRIIFGEGAVLLVKTDCEKPEYHYLEVMPDGTIYLSQYSAVLSDEMVKKICSWQDLAQRRENEAEF